MRRREFLLGLVLLALAWRSLRTGAVTPTARGWLLVAVGLVPIMVLFLCFSYGLEASSTVIVTRNDVRRAKPDPDLFTAAAQRLAADIESAVIVGDSIWDMLAARRARGLGVGLLSGGYGQDELERAGAIRVYEDPADLLEHIDEIGGRP